jgi:tetratricopeptide (TPR) repeat protein
MFFGRSEEMTEIRYYLDHATAAERPINLALLGDRAAGKTSILNMTEIEARSRNCCTTRIDLDEDDAKSQLLFFYKMFDGIITAACQLGAFGGLAGKTYETYLNTMSCFSVAEDKLFSPFLFPVQFALAMKAGNNQSPVSDHAVKHDLALITDELKRPIVVLFDESNVLAQSRVLLEKIRNIFMNIPGYMLVLTGTPDLFPIMDDVFSPIVRQFKKINVKEFEKKSDTDSCIRKPLQKFGIPIEVSKSEVRDIHDLSGGKPYEIQLICHLLFRRIQKKEASRMRLDLSILEELRKELESSQDISGRKVLGAVMSLNRKQLQALGILTQCDGRATFEQLWILHYAFEGTREFTRNQLEAEFGALKSKGVLSEIDNMVSFAGDTFDRLYVKYFAAEQRIRIDVRSFSLELALMVGITQFALPAPDFAVHLGTEAWTQHEAAARSLCAEDPSSDPFSQGRYFVDELYFKMIDFRRRGEIPVLFLSISLCGAATAAIITPTVTAKEDAVERLRRNLGPVKSRVENTGGSLVAERRSLPVASVDRLSAKVLQSENEPRRKELARKHARALAGAWIDGKIEEASVHAKLAHTYDPTQEAKPSNNLGYFLMATGEEARAEQMFKHAIETAGEDLGTKALATYNLAILMAKKNNSADALRLLQCCITILADVSTDDKNPGCLQLPEIRDGRLAFGECSNPSLDRACADAISVIQKSVAVLD